MGHAESGGNHESEGSGTTQVRADSGGNDGSKRLCRESGYEVMKGTMLVRSRLGSVQRKIISG
jgi:hypothetical protein